ncbi:hypothetical protein [Tenacibaculum sp. IB213877]|uniref:hypothetical protein n=1 Tax=Tenacibaculum sp. IB213877 TaxID=3097351 RepID=UPI002A599B48|nr:hypothetical protein [Tenacibaculum sp. IB213877]MDY0781037.1 hypothetical protein [Tenacibaculum sp. IB213877]
MKEKSIFRIFLTTLIIIITQFKIFEYYGIIASTGIVILLVFDIFEKNHSSDLIPELIYYANWILIGVSTFSIRGSSVVPYTPIFIILIIKTISCLIFLLRYKSLIITRTIISKINLIFIALYFMELLFNSTHGIARNTVFWTKISFIELLALIILFKNRVEYTPIVIKPIFQKIKNYVQK